MRRRPWIKYLYGPKENYKKKLPLIDFQCVEASSDALTLANLFLWMGAYSLNGIKQKYFADMYGLHIDTLCWKCVFILEAPPHKEMPSFVHVNNLYCLYGGYSESENKVFGDLWSLNCSTFRGIQYRTAYWRCVEANET